MCKVLFIGSNPSQRSTSIEAFWTDTKSSAILRSWIDKMESPIGTTFHYGNSCNHVTPNNRPLKVSEIRAGSEILRQLIESIKPTHIVALGKTATKALMILDVSFLEFPHPSGLNRKLNDPKYVEDRLKELSEYLAQPSN